MFPSLLIIVKDLEKVEDEGDLDLMPYKETCSLCKGNGYITIVVEGKDEIKQCWLCESKGEKEYSQTDVDKLIYETYYKNERRNIDKSKGNQSSD